MTKNSSSSQEKKGVDSQPSHAGVARDSHIGNTEGKPSSFMLPLVDDDIMLMLTAASLESVKEPDSGIRNLKPENVSAEVKAAVQKAISLERDPDIQNLNHGPAASFPHKISMRLDTLDEERTKFSSMARSRGVESDFSARMGSAKRGLVEADLMDGLISGSLQVHCLEREPSNKQKFRDPNKYFIGCSTGRKRRQNPSESESKDLPSTVVYPVKETQILVTTEGSAEGNCTSDSNGENKRRLTLFKAPQDQRAGNVNKDMPRLNPEKVSTDDGCRNEPEVESESEEVREYDRNRQKAAEKVGNAVDDRKNQSKMSQDAETVVTDRTTRVMAETQMVESGAQLRSNDEDIIFPKGWKYHGLAQIAAMDEATNGPVKKLCARTDGYKWRCPLRAVEGFSLCQHHLNKAQEKKMGKRKI